MSWSDGSREEYTYVAGKIEGKSIIYDSNGDKEECEYINGEKQGFSFVYKADGTLEEKYYKDDEEVPLPLSYQYLTRDKKRVNLDSYDESILFDYKKGHWDLYNNKDKELMEKEENKKVYARDPKLDINENGIIGIDFGTKSTVVVFRDAGNKIFPMRISGTTLNKKIDNTDYENPTVIEFKNLSKFLEEYNSQEGRPHTHWNDLTISHTAFQNLVSGNNTHIMSNIKQWAASKNKKLMIKDKKGKERIISSYMELKDEDVDPIELYAYYLGSYINNMRNGIYLEYYLSFPVTYEKEIREKILKSFEKGIKKSLPISILQDESVMKNFEVKHGSNEPAAYAICELQEYGFEPEDDEKVYYGVFDFGGGTTDFDFGIWRASEDDRNYDFELEHFGAGGDRYLGGENILLELAYEVFKNNKDKLRENKITFIRPEWCERFVGDELVIDFSQESNSNMRQFSEKLRGYWEKSEDFESEEKIKVNLFNKFGELKNGFELDIDEQMIEEIIESKIRRGVFNFFYALQQAFKNEEYDILNILLAGNFSKHPFVKKVFEEYIEKNQLNAELYPALATEEAYIKMKELGLVFDKEDMAKPTGKTGVAYGILQSRPGGRIKIINRDEEKNNLGKINFKYYVGYERRKKFKPLLTPQTEYNRFTFLGDIVSKNIDIYYTSLPEAIAGKMPIENVKTKRLKLQDNYIGSKLYIRIISSDKIEYAITNKDIIEKDYLEIENIVLD